jgi:hypothetical protein
VNKEKKMLKIVYSPYNAEVIGAFAAQMTVRYPYVWCSFADWQLLCDKKLKVVDGVLQIIPEPEKILAEYDKAMEEHIYSVRAARGYTTREPGVYINSTVPRWKADAEVWNAWLDAVMQYSLAILNSAKETGEIPSLDDYINNAPKIDWREE